MSFYKNLGVGALALTLGLPLAGCSSSENEIKGKVHAVTVDYSRGNKCRLEVYLQSDKGEVRAYKECFNDVPFSTCKRDLDAARDFVGIELGENITIQGIPDSDNNKYFWIQIIKRKDGSEMFL